MARDRREVALAVSRLTTHMMRQLSRPEVLVSCYAAGTLVGACGGDIGRSAVELLRRGLTVPPAGA